MLALTRKKDEAIVIDGKIKIKVLDINDGKVKIGIEAPKEMSIYREEVYLEIETVNKGALEKDTEVMKALTTLLKAQK